MKFISIVIFFISFQAGAASSTGYSIQGSQRLSIGAEVGAASPIGYSNSSESDGLGVLGSYKLDPNWSIQGDMFFSSHKTTYQFYSWYGPYSQSINSNSVALTVGPVYRPTSRRFSPVLGALASYQHDYSNVSNTYSYGQQPSYGSDSLYAGPMAGLEYRITRDITIGLDVRYMLNLASRTDLPQPYNTNANQNYYMAGVNLKFSF